MKRENITLLKKKEPCSACGKPTHRWDKKWQWYICNGHDSLKVAEGIAEHVFYPNGD